MYLNFLWLIGQVTLQPEIRTLPSSGLYQQLGSLTFTLRSNALYEVDSSHLINLELQLPEPLSLSESLVDFEDSALNSEPIYLPLMLDGDRPGAIAAPANSLRIARWRRGERSIWLQVLASSSYWVQVEGVKQPPSEDFPVSFRLGASIEKSREMHQSAYERGRATLPFGQREGKPVHVFLLVDVKETLPVGERISAQVHSTVATESCNIRSEMPGYCGSHSASSAVFDGSSTLGLVVEPEQEWFYRDDRPDVTLEITHIGQHTGPVALQWLEGDAPPFVELIEAAPGRLSIPWPDDRHLLLVANRPIELGLAGRTTNLAGQGFDQGAAALGVNHRFLLPDGHEVQIQLYNPQDQSQVIHISHMAEGLVLEARETRRLLLADHPSIITIESSSPTVCQLTVEAADQDALHWKYAVPPLN